VCEPIFERPLREISFGVFLLTLFRTARRFNMQVQPQLVLLQKTLLHIEGLGRQLNPELDLWKTAKPFLENWMKEKAGPRSLANKLRYQFPRWADQFPELPNLIQGLLRQASSGTIKVQLQRQEIDELRREIRRANRRSFHAVVGAALLLSAFLVLGVDGLPSILPGDGPLLTWVLGGLGALVLLSAWPMDS
jgi:ubiquinone biosynthesis protein